jgi:glycerate kinase
MKRFLLVPDSFKGTMDAGEVCAIWEKAIQTHCPGAYIKNIPMSDGGEGMVDSYLRICGGERIVHTVRGPLGEPVQAAYGILPDGAAVMEMAACAGLPLVGENKNPMITTTWGVGELLLAAAQKGVKNVILGLGGSATNDCGIGLAAAIGYRFTDKNGQDVAPLAKNMQLIAHIQKPQKPLGLTVTAACDVDNPLYGPTGATYTFGMQKGADEAALALLDAGLANMAEVIKNDLSVDVANIPGAGAAGGLGGGTVAFLGGVLKPGIELLLDAAKINDELQTADIVFTGEGRIDWQSAHGKVPVGVSRRAKKFGVPCVALCGSLGQGYEAVYEEGITAVFSSISRPGTFEEIKSTCREDMVRLVDSVLRLLLIAF